MTDKNKEIEAAIEYNAKDIEGCEYLIKVGIKPEENGISLRHLKTIDRVLRAALAEQAEAVDVKGLKFAIDNNPIDHEGEWHWAGCNNQECPQWDDLWRTKEQAIKSWNTRAVSPPPDEVMEKATQALKDWPCAGIGEKKRKEVMYFLNVHQEVLIKGLEALSGKTLYEIFENQRNHIQGEG